MKVDWPLTLYHDAACPLCAREVNYLRKHCDAAQLILIDISAAEFNAKLETGKRLHELQARLHGRDASGKWFTGLDATRASYLAAGFNRTATLLGWPPLHWLLEHCYRLFAFLRPSLQWLPHPDGAARCAKQICETSPSNSKKP